MSPARTRAILTEMEDVIIEGANKNRKYRLHDKNNYKEKAEICKNRRGLHYLWNWASQIHRNGQSCRSNLYVRFLKILVIVPFGSVASSTLSGNRMVSHTAVSYFKYFLSVVFEAVTIALSIIVSNAILSYGIFDISGRGTGWTGFNPVFA